MDIKNVKPGTLFKGIGGILIVFLIFIGGCNSCTRIAPTEAGFKVSNSGNYRGVNSLPLLTGWVFYMPGISHVITIPTTQQHIVWTASGDEGSPKNQEIKISCLGGSGFTLDIGVNYHVVAVKASKIWLTWGTSDLDVVSTGFLRNAARGALNDVSGTITMDSILNNLPGFEAKARELFASRVEPYGFAVDLFNIISQPRPLDPNVAESIKNKIKAKQDAETAIMQLQISVAEANKAIAPPSLRQQVLLKL